MILKTIFKPELIKNFPVEVKKIFEIFSENEVCQNPNILLVGGCVRDLLAEKSVNDFDFATKFLPDEIIEILTINKIKSILTGKKFGTITAVVNNKNFEITTLRKDDETDGRYAKVKFVDDYFEDAKRRDFTINALYLDKNGNIFDYFDGYKDLKGKELKFIGDANQRIIEDYLRILRFFRFNLSYAKNFDKNSLQSCIKNKEGLKVLSRERVRLEFLKIIFSEKKLKILEILEIFDKSQISQNLFSSKIDIKKLGNLFLFQEIFSLKVTNKLKIASLFVINGLDIEKFYQDICATKAEKRFINFLQKKSTNSSEESLNLNSIKILLLDFDKEFIRELFIFNLVKNFNFDNIDEKKIFQIKVILKYLENFSLPIFPINIEEIKNDFVDNNLFYKSLKEVKSLWASSDFTLTSQKINKFLKKKSKIKFDN